MIWIGEIKMTKTTLKIDGMMCGMCEAHINDAIRGAFPVKKVSASHSKGEAVVITEVPLDEGGPQDRQPVCLPREGQRGA